MNNLAQNPEEFFEYSRLYTLSVASTLIFGKRVSNIKSDWYRRFFDLMSIVSDSHLSLVVPSKFIHTDTPTSGLSYKSLEQTLPLMNFHYSNICQDHGKSERTSVVK